jgi:hypothetical protein
METKHCGHFVTCGADNTWCVRDLSRLAFECFLFGSAI